MRIIVLPILILLFGNLHPPQFVSSISVNNVQDITLLRQISFEESTFRDLVFSPDSENLLVSVHNRNTAENLNGEVVFLSVDDLAELNLSPHQIAANTLAFSPDGTLFAVGTESGEVSVFDSNTFEKLVTFKAGVDIINDLAISEDNQFIAVTLAIPTIGINGAAAFRLVTLVDGAEIFAHPLETDRHGAGVTFDKSGNDVFFSISDFSEDARDTLYALNIATESVQSLRDANCGDRHHLFFVPHLHALICPNYNINVIYPLGDNNSDYAVRRFNETNEQIVTLGLHPTEPILAIGYFVSVEASEDNHPPIQLFNYETGDELVSLHTPDEVITNIAFSPDGALLASANLGGVVRLWGIPADDDE